MCTDVTQEGCLYNLKVKVLKINSSIKKKKKGENHGRLELKGIKKTLRFLHGKVWDDDQSKKKDSETVNTLEMIHSDHQSPTGCKVTIIRPSFLV